MSKICFVDTSVLVELLNIPGMNAHHEDAKLEYQLMAEEENVFILPVATLVETGNHIAHISDGSLRYSIALKFAELIEKARTSIDNWNVQPEISSEVLGRIIEQIPSHANVQTGFGDISIIEQFLDYQENHQPIGEMCIWSYDHHLQSYSYIGGLTRRKNK